MTRLDGGTSQPPLVDGPVVAYRPELGRILGSVNAALVLQQIHYWMPMATKEYDGHAWIYKRHEDFSEELGITGAQARGAVDLLRDTKLIISRRNPYYAMDQIRWYRIDYEALGRLIKASRLIESTDGLPTNADGLPSNPDDLPPAPDELTLGPAQYQETTNREDHHQITSAAVEGEQASGDHAPAQEDWLELLTLFVKLMARVGVGKPEYIEEDIAKPEWQRAFRDGVQHHGAAAVEDALLRLVDRLERPSLDPGTTWRDVLRGPKSAQAFIRRIPQLQPLDAGDDDAKRFGEWR